MFIFVSVRFLSKEVTKPNFFLKKKTETEPKPVQTDRFRFGFLEQKPVQTGLARFFPVWIGFFLVWLGFAQFFPGFLFRVRFGFSCSMLKKQKPNRTGRFFQNFNRFNRFFFTVRFFRLLFFRFSRFNRFFGFFEHP